MTLSYDHGWEHGAHLRTFAITREWVRQGAEVHFIALEFKHSDPEVPGPYLERLREARIITGFDRIVLQHPVARGKLARAALHPAARDLIMRPERRAMTAELDAIARRVRPDAFVYIDTHLLFAATHLRRHARVAVDWKDCMWLQNARGARLAAGERNWHATAERLFDTSAAGLEERYYGRRVDHNIMVSPVDAASLRRLVGSAAPVHTVPNGIRAVRVRPGGSGVPDRLIFTGAMNFPPNYEAALWFVKHVLPLIVARRPTVRFVLAGSDPGPELRALAGPNVEVTGWVDDMRAELARSALYVAPMTSGSGFKNKVVEALAAGRNVVGTPFAFEFLPERLRRLFPAADGPQELADAVLAALDDPAGNDAAVERFWELAGTEFDWPHIAERFAAAVGRPAPAPRR